MYSHFFLHYTFGHDGDNINSILHANSDHIDCGRGSRIQPQQTRLRPNLDQSRLHVTQSKAQMMDEYLESLYYDPKKSGSFSGPRALYKVVKSEGKRVISMEKIKKWLKSQEVYTMHRKMVRKFKRNKVQVDHIDEQWDVDLMDMTDYAKENDGIKYVLMAIDIFSRYAWAVPLVNKQASTIKKGIDELVKKGRRPNKIRTDPGGEFIAQLMKQWFTKMNILHSVTHNQVKANYVERLIKTIKHKIVKYFQKYNTLRYVDYLEDFMMSYNILPLFCGGIPHCGGVS